MEIAFDNKHIGIYREISHQIKRVQETAESVVPDTNDDIGKIASVQTSMLLKSKDVTSRCVLITGELTAALIYITESEKSVSSVRLSKPFTLEYDLPDADADALAHVNLIIQNSESRVINPRKVSVTFELFGELSLYRQETAAAETTLPESAPEGLHVQCEETELVTACAVMEKTFAVNEQFPFPPGKPKPAQLVAQSVDFALSDTQLIGTKAIIKGCVNITLCYLSSEVNYPVRAEFSTPFSQIIDTAEENTCHCSALVQLTSAYCSIADTINGDKALDAELHAVLQLVCHRRECVKYISDAYSNLMPSSYTAQTRQLAAVSAITAARLTADERVTVVEDCEDVLSVFTSLSQVSVLPDKLSAVVTLDIIYRTTGGTLSAVRRLVGVENAPGVSQARLMSARLADVYLRPDGASIDAHISVELNYQTAAVTELTSVERVTLDDQSPYDISAFPALTLVRVEGESLWQLAKTYHSSVERIKQLNPPDSDDAPARLMLIPKAL